MDEEVHLSSNELQRQIIFLREIEKLKTIQRANKTLDRRCENSAEHSWHVALMALLLEEQANETLDMLKVVKMLLIHDIVEIDAGDTWLFAEDQGSKETAETAAAERIFSLLPDNQKLEYIALWHGFETRASEEAKYAAVIDGIHPLLNHLITGDASDGVIAVEKVRSKKAYIAEFAPKLWPLVESLIEESESKGLYN